MQNKYAPVLIFLIAVNLSTEPMDQHTPYDLKNSIKELF